MKDKCELIQFPKHSDITGTLFVADKEDLPFVPKRVFWMTGLRGKRGGHALRTCDQIIIALRGQFDVRAYRKRNAPMIWTLKFNYHGLYLPKMTYRDLYNFSVDTICLVLCSHPFDPDDYIDELGEFLDEIS